MLINILDLFSTDERQQTQNSDIFYERDKNEYIFATIHSDNLCI